MHTDNSSISTYEYLLLPDSRDKRIIYYVCGMILPIVVANGVIQAFWVSLPDNVYSNAFFGVILIAINLLCIHADIWQLGKFRLCKNGIYIKYPFLREQLLIWECVNYIYYCNVQISLGDIRRAIRCDINPKCRANERNKCRDLVYYFIHLKEIFLFINSENRFNLFKEYLID